MSRAKLSKPTPIRFAPEQEAMMHELATETGQSFQQVVRLSALHGFTRASEILRSMHDVSRRNRGGRRG